jgi:tRNA threonylcarbamoyladenosine biosynthesis protein TsaE
VIASFSLESRSIEQTVALASAVGERCRAGDVVALSGELGAGKTQFVRGLACGMGIDPGRVSSPTFVIAQEYEAGDAAGVVLVHIDAYRLHSGEELASLGWAGEGGDLRAGAVLAVEWADRVLDALGPDRLEVRLEHAPDGRRITLTGHGDWSARMIALKDRVDAETNDV